MTNRRHFLGRLSFGLTMAPLLNALPGAAKERIRIGAQTNTWGVPITPYEHFLEVVKVLGTLGYQGFETNYNCLKSRADRPAECRKEFEARNIGLIAAHNGSRLFDKEKIAAEIENLRQIAGSTVQMGATYLIVSGTRLPHVDGRLDQNAAHVKMDALNQLGRVCQKEGLKLCYHNHQQEFEDDSAEMNFFLKETDPKLVALNYDVGNSSVGPDAGAFSASHFRRIPIYHIKDIQPNPGGKPINTDLGAGVINLKGVVAPLLKSDWEGWLTVEREGSYPRAAANPEQLLKQCREYLKQITAV